MNLQDRSVFFIWNMTNEITFLLYIFGAKLTRIPFKEAIVLFCSMVEKNPSFKQITQWLRCNNCFLFIFFTWSWNTPTISMYFIFRYWRRYCRIHGRSNGIIPLIRWDITYTCIYRNILVRRPPRIDARPPPPPPTFWLSPISHKFV